jgi:hypothetical protein
LNDTTSFCFFNIEIVVILQRKLINCFIMVFYLFICFVWTLTLQHYETLRYSNMYEHRKVWEIMSAWNIIWTIASQLEITMLTLLYVSMIENMASG